MATKTFLTGEVLTAADTNTYLANSGLVFVKSQTVGTAVSSVTVANAFSATYDNYKIMYSGGTASGGSLIGLRLGATAANYKNSYIYTSWNNTVTGSGSAADATFARFGRAGTLGTSSGACELLSPFLTVPTRFVGQDISATDGGMFVGYMDNTTSYTDFTLIPSGVTLTGGTVTVYGYRKA